jgi:glutamine amidotransferase
VTAGPVIVNSGGANISSLRFALARLGVEAPLSADPERIAAASHVFLPGVGAAADAMRRLGESGLAPVIAELTRPVLGICLGMQLMFEASEEDGGTDCLRLVPGRVGRMRAAPNVPVPHMGWSRTSVDGRCPLFGGLPDGGWFYYVHGYAAPPGRATVATASHGGIFAAAVAHDNFLGVQFHPERSGADGARVLANFLTM